jgi:Txe/YoeB family toxin of Txe-Axe toxin-antitoxin module
MRSVYERSAEGHRQADSKLRGKLKDIIDAISVDPKCGKRLVRDLEGLYSVSLSFQDRIVYSFDDKGRVVIVHRARTHYGD